MAKCLSRPQHTFIFLTKRPQNLPKKFPDNCWVGVSVTNREMLHRAKYYIESVKAKIKFISFEPLMDDVMQFLYADLVVKNCDWIIIGARTPLNKKTQPKIEWIKEIVEAADKAGIPIFLKNNLLKLLPREEPFIWWMPNQAGGELAVFRQELPL